MSEPTFLGLDIGGANIKHCSNDGVFGSLPFELWKHPEKLAAAIADVPGWKSADHVAITMTGELADCFENKSQGVAAICESVNSAAMNGQTIGYYQTSGKFVDACEAKASWNLTAASNWHALASLVGRVLPDCVLIDIGSTTTDLIPVCGGLVTSEGTTDLTRLAAGELLYTGVVRSPVCSVVRFVALDGTHLPIAQELFSNMLDVYLILGKIKERSNCRHTADGRAANKAHSFKRLARMLCADESELNQTQLVSIAHQIAERHLSLIKNAILRIKEREQNGGTFVVTGEGGFVAEAILEKYARIGTAIGSDAVAKLFDANSRPAIINTSAAVMFLYRSHVMSGILALPAKDDKPACNM